MSIIWKIKQDGQTLIMPNPDHGPKAIGAAKNYLRKHSRKVNAIFDRADL